MSGQKKSILAGICVLLAVVGILSYLKLKKPLNPSEFVAEQQKIRHRESKRLIEKGASEDPQALHRALLSIANEVDPDLVPEIKALLQHSNPLVRAAAAYALSFQKDDDSKSIVEKLASDPNLLIRTYLIHAAKQNPEVYREKALRTLLTGTDLTEADRIEAMSALLLSLKDNNAQEVVFNEMLSKVNIKNIATSEKWIRALNEIRPTDVRVLKVDQEVLKTSTDPLTLSVAIRNLAKQSDPVLMKTYSKWIHSAERGVMLAALESLHFACPAERWSWIEEGYHAQPEKLNQVYWILEAERLGGSPAKEFIEKAIEENKKLKIDAKVKELELVLSRIQRASSEDPCKGRMGKTNS